MAQGQGNAVASKGRYQAVNDIHGETYQYLGKNQRETIRKHIKKDVRRQTRFANMYGVKTLDENGYEAA